MALGAILTCFSSCTKDDPGNQEEEIIIDSEILDSGYDSDVTAVTDETNGTTTLSYTAWIEVSQTTAKTRSGNGGERIEVTIVDTLRNVEFLTSVPSLNIDLSQPTLDTSSYYVGVTPKHKYVNAIDSVMCVTVRYGEGYNFTYELPFQSPAYADGVKSFDMPYLGYENFQHKESKLSDVTYSLVKDNNDKDIVVASAVLTNSITLTFNDKDYVLSARITLNNILGDVDNSIINSELLEKGISVLESTDYYIDYASWIRVKQTMYNGSTQEKKYTLKMHASTEKHTMLSPVRIPDVDIKRERVDLFYDVTDEGSWSNVEKYLYQTTARINHVVTYNHFDVTTEFLYDDGYYFDSMSEKIRFPILEYSNFSDKFKCVFENSNTEAGTTYNNYWFTHTANADIGNITHDGTTAFGATVAEF
ncbi:MAG: hypothetical protein LBR70_02875 [Lactobacillaceae bacterium]|nr:hypothetical protein [Lactobacillaceae bacterium]